MSDDAYVSTGVLPPVDVVAALLDEAHERFRTDRDGERSDVYPALAQVSADLFGVCVTNVAGSSIVAGDVDVEFSIMSVAKPFVFALVSDARRRHSNHGPR